MDLRVFRCGSLRFIIPVSMLPESGTLAIFPAENVTPTMAQPSLPVTCQLISEETLLPLTAEDLLPILRSTYPSMSLAALRHSWLNGAPFLGVPADQWPLRTYHFPGLGEVPPMSVLPTASLVTAPFLSGTNAFAWSPLTSITQQLPDPVRTAHLSLPSAAAGGPSTSSNQDPPVLSAISFSDFGLSSTNTGLFSMPSTSTGMMENPGGQEPEQFSDGLGQAVSNVLNSDTTAPDTISAAPASVVTSVPVNMVAPLAVSTTTTSSTTDRPVLQMPTGSVAPRSRSGKRSSSSRSEGTHSKRRSNPDTRHVVHRHTPSSSSHGSQGGAAANFQPTDHRVSSSDPLLSTTSSRQGSSQQRAAANNYGAPVPISSESSD